MDGTPSTSIPFKEPKEDYNYEYGKEQPSDLSPYFINLYTKEQFELNCFHTIDGIKKYETG